MLRLTCVMSPIAVIVAMRVTPSFELGKPPKFQPQLQLQNS